MFKIKLPVLLRIVILVFVSLSCSNNKTNKENIVSDKIVLKIGKTEITEYEFEKNFSRAFSQEKVNDKLKAEWIELFINNTFLLADAYEKKYDTVSLIKKVLQYATNEMVACEGGYLWNKVEEPKLKISKSEIKNSYDKLDKIYYIEYLKANTEQDFINVIGSEYKQLNVETFKKASLLFKQNPEVKHEDRIFAWPFNELYSIRDSVIRIQQGSISRPLYNNGTTYIIYLKKVEPVKMKPLKEMRDEISTNLKFEKSQEIAIKKQNEIFLKSKIEINKDILDYILEKLDKVSFNELSNLITCDSLVMSYLFNGELKQMRVFEFYDYYLNNPFAYSIKNKDALIEYLKNYVIQKYLMVEADKEGVLNDKKFILDKRNYFNSLILMEYEKNEFENKIVIPEDEIKNYYEQNKESYIDGKTCTIILLTFETREDALLNLDIISNLVNNDELYNLADTNVIKGLILYQPNIKLDYSNKLFNQELTRNLFIAEINSISFPFEMDNKFSLYIKTKEEGNRIVSYEEIKPYLEKKLLGLKTELIKKERIEQLKNKYTLSINKTNE